jgi:hypothetical protein
MAFENLGVGGTLTFDEKPALGGMRRANQAFHQIEGAAEHFRERMDVLGASMERFNLIGLGLGSLGIVGLEELGKQAFEAQTQFEDMQVVLSTILGITRHMDIGTSVKVAADEMDRLEIAAAKAPGETEDLLGIYKQIVGPMSAMGASLDKVQDLTVSSAIAAQALGLPFQDMAFSMEKLISGEVRAEDSLFRMLRSMHLITETAAEWKQLSDEKRMGKIDEVMMKFGARANQVGDTWTAVAGTVKSIVKILERAAIKPIFEKVRDSVHKLTDDFINNMDHYKQLGAEVGKRLYAAFELVVEALKQLVSDGVAVYQWMDRMSARAAQLFGEFGIGGDKLHAIKVHLLEIAFAMGALLPMFSLMRTVLSPATAAIGVLTSGIKYLWTVASSGLEALAGALGIELLPLLLIIGAAVGVIALAIMAARADGEDFTDTLSRWWTEGLKPWWDAFKESFARWYPDIIEPLKDAWYDLRQSGRLLFDTLAGSMDVSEGQWQSWGATAGNAIGAVVTAVSTLISYFGKLMAFVFFVVANIKYAFQSVEQAVAQAILAPIDMLKGLVDKVAKLPGGAQFLKAQGLDNFVANLGDYRNLVAEKANEHIESPADQEIKLQEKRAEDEDRKKGMRAMVAMLGYAMAPPSASVTVEDKRCVEVNSNLHVDGRHLAAAQARHQIEIMDRSGAQATPWQRRAAVVRAKEMGGPK